MTLVFCISLWLMTDYPWTQNCNNNNNYCNSNYNNCTSFNHSYKVLLRIILFHKNYFSIIIIHIMIHSLFCFLFLIFQNLMLCFDGYVHKTSYFIVSLKLLQFICWGVNLHIGRSTSVFRPSLRKPSPVIWSERQSHERRNTVKAEKEEDTIPFVPEVYRMPFFLWK